jgi:hypothetical protein
MLHTNVNARTQGNDATLQQQIMEQLGAANVPLEAVHVINNFVAVCLSGRRCCCKHVGVWCKHRVHRGTYMCKHHADMAPDNPWQQMAVVGITFKNGNTFWTTAQALVNHLYHNFQGNALPWAVQLPTATLVGPGKYMFHAVCSLNYCI